jgi:hypothetical protein
MKTLKNVCVVVITSLVFWACEEDKLTLSEDCAGVADGDAICGCTDSTAVNYLSSATSDDGSCVHYVDNGDFYLTFNGADFVDVGDVLPQGAYTKAVWVKREYGYGAPNNIVSGDESHAFWAPYGEGSKLSAGHNGSYTVVQDTDSLPTGVWTFVAVTYDPDVESGTMTLYRNGNQVDAATGVSPHNESSKTYIGRYGNGNYWSGAMDEVAIWDKALSSSDVETLYNAGYDLTNASENSENYALLTGLKGYWRMNEGEGSTLSDASGNGNIGTISGAAWSTCDDCGCMDPTACNYDSEATVDNRTCVFVDDNCDGDGVLDEDDSHPYDNMACADADQDGCDDCSSGYNDPSNDGPDDDGDGICNAYIISGRTVYIVGNSYNEEGNLTACYWIDGSRVELPGGAWATDIVVVNGTVYTSGTGEASDACYWINETRYDLPGNGGEAEAIAVDSNGVVYVAGWYNDGSCYWKDGVKINLTTNAESQSFAIGLRYNGDVFVGGYYMNNHHYYIPCYWKNGNNRYNLSIPSGGDGEVNDMAIMDGNTRYYAGYTLHPSSFAGYTPKACHWRNAGNRTDLPLGGSSMDIYGATGKGIAVDGGDIYVAGYTDWYEDTNNPYTTGGSFPQYWKNSTIHDLPGGPLTNFGTGVANDIRVADGDVIVVGEATRDTSYSDSFTAACYWINGELHYLVNQNDVPDGLEDWDWGSAKGVFIE